MPAAAVRRVSLVTGVQPCALPISGAGQPGDPAPGAPLLVGVSPKRMIGRALGRPVDRRLAGGLALATLAVVKGGRIIRVHDVAETVDAVRMTEAVLAAGRS